MEVLALPGSLRRSSRNRSLLIAAAQCAPAAMTVNLFDDLASVPLFSEDLEGEQYLPAPVRRLRRAVASADGVLIATPEYNQSIPGVLKNALDWLSRSDELADKPVAVTGATTGPWGTRPAQAAVRHVLHATGSLILPGPALYVRDSERLFDGAGRLVDRPTRDALAELLAAFARWIEAMPATPAM